MASRARRLVVATAGVLAAYVAVQLLFWAGLALAHTVPDDRVVSGLAQAVVDEQYGPSYVPDGVGGKHDKWTECVELGYGLGASPRDGSFLGRVVYAPRLGSCMDSRARILALDRGETVQGNSYARYWNGYSVLTRPALAEWGVPGLRAAVTALLVVTAGFAIHAVGRRTGGPVAFALLAPVAASTNLLSTPAYAFTHAISWCAILLGAGLVAVAAGRWGWPGGAAAAALSGALFNYVDLLTTPAAPWALSAFVATGTVLAAGARWPTTVKALLSAGAAWPVAYAVTWASKWGVSAALLGEGTLSQVQDLASTRLSGAYEDVSTAWGAATWANLEYWLATMPTAWGVLGVAAVVVLPALVVAVRRHGPAALATALVLCVPALTVPFWFEVMKNHSQVHVFFTHRSVPVAVGVVTAAVLLTARRREPAHPPETAADVT